MKGPLLLAAAAVIAAAYALHREHPALERAPTDPPAETAQAKPVILSPQNAPAEPERPARKLWKRDELIIVQGTVFAQTNDGLVIDSFIPPPPMQISLPADAGNTATKNWAEIARNQREGEGYGNLIVVENSVPKTSGWRPAAKTSGRVVLVGFPHKEQLGVGQKVKVITAPLNEPREFSDFKGRRVTLPAFTAQFKLDEPAGSWIYTNFGQQPNMRQ